MSLRKIQSISKPCGELDIRLRRDKTNFKSKLIIKFFVETAAFTVLCIPVLLILNSYYQDYYDKLEEFDKSTAEHVSSYNVLWFIVFYCPVAFINIAACFTDIYSSNYKKHCKSYGRLH